MNKTENESNSTMLKMAQEIAKHIKNEISKTQLEIMINANSKLVNLYFNIGKTLEENSRWGNKFIDNIAMELKLSFPNLKGFSVRNLKYMKTFYHEYKEEHEFVQLVAQLPWKHNITLMQKIKDKEKELENKMLERLKNVLLELGNDFSFVGNQYKITVDNQDFYMDLLFYHIQLKCYIAVELKVVEFKPEFASKMGFYLTVLDQKIKDENDNPSIGIILCQNKSNKIVDYTLKYINKPVGVSEYKVFDQLSHEIQNKLPTQSDINTHFDILN